MPDAVAAVEAASVWSTLLPVVVGGGLALVGTAIGPLATSWWNERQAARRTKTQKLEDLLTQLFEFDDWVSRRDRERVFGEAKVTDPSPMARALTTSALFFPDLLPEIRAFDRAAKVYDLWQLGASTRRLSGDSARVNDGLIEAYGPYQKSFIALQDKISTIANVRGNSSPP